MTKPAKTIGTALNRQAPGPIPRAMADGLENAVAAMGGSRDKMSYNTWEMGRKLTQVELQNMYRSSWLAGKIITIPAEDMTREWRTVLVDEDNGDMKALFEKAERKFKIKSKVNEAVMWARLYGGSVIIIGTKDGMSAPKNELKVENVRRGDLRYLHVLDRWRITPGTRRTTDIMSPNFGLPETYIIADSAVEIHWTRVIRFNGRKLPYYPWIENGFWDDPILTQIMDSLMQRETSTKAVATMMFEANVDVISGADMNNLLTMKGGEALLAKRFGAAALMKSFNRTLLLDSTESYEKKSNAFSNLDKIMQEFMSDVAGAADIPVTRLFGQSPAGMNATGEADIRNYYDRISNEQEADLRDPITYLDQILYQSEVGDTYPEDFTWEFNSLWQMSDKEKAEVEKARAERDKIYLDAGVIHAGVVARELHDRGTYATLTGDDVELIEELAKPIEGDPEDPEVGIRETKAKAPAPALGAIDPATGLPTVDPATGLPKPAVPGAKPPVPGQDSKKPTRKKK